MLSGHALSAHCSCVSVRGDECVDVPECVGAHVLLRKAVQGYGRVDLLVHNSDYAPLGGGLHACGAFRCLFYEGCWL